MERNYSLYFDCICVDSTLNTNKYKMPLVTFTGISHLGRLIVLGIAFVPRFSGPNSDISKVSLCFQMRGKNPIR